MNNEYHDIVANYQTHTDKALCVEIDLSDYWFPLMAIKHDVMLSDFKRDDEIELQVQAWVLIENDLEWMVEE